MTAHPRIPCLCGCSGHVKRGKKYASHACYIRHAATMPRPEQAHKGGRPSKAYQFSKQPGEQTPLIAPPRKDTRDWQTRQADILAKRNNETKRYG